MARVDQHADPSGGCSYSVSAAIAAAASALSDRAGPRPPTTVPSHSNPPASKPRRHALTVFGATPHRRAVSSLAVPSTADSKTRA